ncbi:MAG TPA: CHAT domain-containing tetratricopeptide repeat protein [Terriglobia bacterium]|nr:CHAT domain-containing tetratricopeptide repeat protein [Terriglobia bacterium]
MSNERVGCYLTAIIALAILATGSLSGQEARWQELNTRVGKLYEEGRYKDAVPVAEEALQVAEQTFGPERPEVAVSLDGLAEMYRAGGRYAEAVPLVARALGIQEKSLGPNDPDVATSLNNLAGLYKAQGKYQEAEPLYQRALGIRERAFGPEHHEVATSLNNLAELYDAEGRYDKAEPLLQRALAIQKKSPDDLGTANVLANLAALYQAQSRYALAEPLLQRALAIQEKSFGPEHIAVADTLDNLATLYEAQGRYAEAEAPMKHALETAEKTLGADHPNLAIFLNNLAELYVVEGRYDQAEPLLKGALAIREKALGPDHLEVAGSLHNLAALYQTQGRYPEAVPLVARALAIREKNLGPEAPSVASSLNSLAELRDHDGNYTEEESLLKRALAIRTKSFGPEHVGVANTLNNLAEVYDTEGKYTEAEPLLKRALAIRTKLLGPDHLDVAETLSNMGAMYYGWQRPEQAEAAFTRSLEIVSNQFQQQFPYMSEADRLSFADTVSGILALYFSFCLTYRDHNPAGAGRMYNVAVWEKGLVARSIAALRARVAASGDKEALEMLDRLTARRSQLAALESNSSKEEPAAAENLERETNEMEEQLARRSAAAAEDQSLTRTTWQDVRRALEPGEAAVEFLRFDSYDGRRWTKDEAYVALVVTPKSAVPAMVPLGEATKLEAQPLQDYLRLVQQRQPTSGAGAAGRAGVAFYEAFWKPLERALGGASRVYFSPDGLLDEVSLGVIPSTDGKLLVDRYDLREVTSTGDLLRRPVNSSANTALLVGNPKFALTAQEHRQALTELREQAALNAQVTLPETANVAGQPGATEPGPGRREAGQADNCHYEVPVGGVTCPLPETEVEVESVAKMLWAKNWQVGVYEQARALEEVVKGAKHPRLLHIATHGLFLANRDTAREGATGQLASEPADPMLRSSLLFAGADRVLKGLPPLEGTDGGELTAYEASGLDLEGTELVVLSACKTGLGTVQNGEGVFGLRRAFEEAGAQSVLMSMWSVPDRETQELVQLFYQKWLGGEEKHEALREAQLEMRETVEARYHADVPYYWGAFVLVGR